MTPGAPRTGAGIESQARELVEDLARRSGLSPSDLLRRLIADEGPEDVTSQDFFNDAEKSPYIETARPGSDAPPRMEALGHPVDELHRVTGALNRLTDRIESAESRSTVVIGGLPSALAFLAAAGLAHLMFEGITYIQHYGLFRVEGERIDERISPGRRKP